ncbi:MAG: geranylgeranylglycerol-phosphate geranylgeranyltransferase [Saprospiraceae bacterium]|nr:geranylgeranylglycerol-phosphate geranylgeranyltransferase [Saprospiraceae bacterium]
MPLFKLIRWPNLVIVALTQILIFNWVLLPSFEQYNIRSSLDQNQFFLLSLVTLLLSAGGYIINDIYDRDIDKIDKPERLIIGKEIDLPTAYWLYFVIHLIGFLLALYLAFVVEKPGYVGLFPLASTGLYVYSRWLKRMPLWGNLLIALYCSGVAGIIWFAERNAFTELAIAERTYQKIGAVLITYLVFAFLTTLFRELIKDMEDIEGDSGGGFRTAPIVWGMNTCRQLVSVLGVVILFFLLAAGWFFWQKLGSPVSGVVLMVMSLPMCLLLFKLTQANEKKHFHQLSQWAKLLMLSGILILFLLEI